MPRGPRLDAPGALHHVMVRGLERRVIFATDRDREDFVTRLARLSQGEGLPVYAWALLPNHAHLVVRTGPVPLSRVMRRLLTGYAVTFNHRHGRTGHLFQNRFKSILVEEEPYLLQLVRYVHLNPIRARLVHDLAALDRYPWSGHARLMGRIRSDWQVTESVLARFGRTVGMARQAYRQFVAEGLSVTTPDLSGGGLRRSAGGWERVSELRRGRERWAFDERVLGSRGFVETVAGWQGSKAALPEIPRDAAVLVRRLIGQAAAELGLGEKDVIHTRRQQTRRHARAVVSYVSVCHAGLPLRTVARELGVSAATVMRDARLGGEIAHRWGFTPAALLEGARQRAVKDDNDAG